MNNVATHQKIGIPVKDKDLIFIFWGSFGKIEGKNKLLIQSRRCNHRILSENL